MTDTFKLLIGAPKYKFVRSKFVRNDNFKYLDIGGGTGQALKDFKTFFPNADYYCIDLLDSKEYEELNKGTYNKYWQKDLAQCDFDDIPNNYFDFVVCTHVIEHLLNGDKMLASIFSKVKVGGFIYVEYPGSRSLHLPKMPGTLNFFDDETHCRIYTEIELNNLFLSMKIKPLKSGVRRNYFRLLFFIPLLLFKSLKNEKGTIAYEFWDILGFAEFIFGRKEDLKVQIDAKNFK